MTVIETARDGSPTLKAQGCYLLSPYQPGRDAARVIPQNPQETAWVLFSEGLGHIRQALADAGVPQEQIFVLEPQELRQLGWQGDEPTRLQSWLENQLLLRRHPSWLSLPSFEKAYPEEYQLNRGAFLDSLQRAVENVKVSGFFSRIWFINHWRNLLQAGGPRFVLGQPLTDTHPVIVTAAGPSLEENIELLQNWQSKAYILAVLSSYNSLRRVGIRPDGVVITDAGVGNVLHARGLDPDIPVFAGPSACSALLARIPNPVIFISQEELSHPVYRVTAPSVSLDAGLLAARLSRGPLLFAGLDLGYAYHASSHSQANAFSERDRSLSGRLSPVYSRISAWMSRTDLETLPRGMTHGQFRQVAAEISREFSGCAYLPGVQDITGLTAAGQDWLPLSQPEVRRPWEQAWDLRPLDQDWVRASQEVITQLMSSGSQLQEQVLVRAVLMGLDPAPLGRITAAKLRRLAI